MTPALTFAIGDIHGCHHALLELLALCRDHAQGQAHRFVFIGDYVDRGPDSRAVIAALRDLERRAPGNVVCLMGNHEDLMLDAIDSGDPTWWLNNGGGQTLLSYGMRDPAGLPPDDIAWVRSLRLSFDDGKRLFVHAGVDPDLPLDRQSREALLWIRGPFHRATKDYGRLIVHGHTPTRDARPEIRPNRINIDTASVYGGVLTAAVFTDERVAPVKFLTAREARL
jgi:diadenosine tetraphosphatase ApaH/serine/threonine PP2A family protein phosphatase